jgi:hypothetical protein
VVSKEREDKQNTTPRAMLKFPPQKTLKFPPEKTAHFTNTKATGEIYVDRISLRVDHHFQFCSQDAAEIPHFYDERAVRLPMILSFNLCIG